MVSHPALSAFIHGDAASPPRHDAKQPAKIPTKRRRRSGCSSAAASKKTEARENRHGRKRIRTVRRGFFHSLRSSPMVRDENMIASRCKYFVFRPLERTPASLLIPCYLRACCFQQAKNQRVAEHLIIPVFQFLILRGALRTVLLQAAVGNQQRLRVARFAGSSVATKIPTKIPARRRLGLSVAPLIFIAR